LHGGKCSDVDPMNREVVTAIKLAIIAGCSPPGSFAAAEFSFEAQVPSVKIRTILDLFATPKSFEAFLKSAKVPPSRAVPFTLAERSIRNTLVE
jgi:hypothetical protein